MARIFLKATPQIEADRNLLKFRCYEEYLDSLSTAQDTCYLQSVETSRTIANLGSTFTITLMKKVFKQSLRQCSEILFCRIQKLWGNLK